MDAAFELCLVCNQVAESNESNNASAPIQITVGAAVSAGSQVSVKVEHDAFVFAPADHIAAPGFNPATDDIHTNQPVFASPTAVLSVMHDDRHGNSITAAIAHDTITPQHSPPSRT
jgi:hypothetical protein